MTKNQRNKILARVMYIVHDSLGTHIAYTFRQKGTKFSQGESPRFHIQTIREYAEALYLLARVMKRR